MPTQLALAGDEHGNVLAVAGFELGIRINVYDLNPEIETGLQYMQARDHVIAQMTVGAT